MCGCGPSVDTYGATLNVHDFVQCYAIEGLLVTPRVCRIYRRFTLLLLVPPQTTVLGATLNAKLRGHTVNAQWPLLQSQCSLSVYSACIVGFGYANYYATKK